MTTQSFNYVTDEIIKIMYIQKRNERTITSYKQRWRHLEHFMIKHSESCLTLDICDAFLLETIGEKDATLLTQKEIRMLRAILLIKDYITYGKIKPRKMIIYFEGEIGEAIKGYIIDRKKDRLKHSTITMLEQSMFMFAEFLKSQNINTLNDITISHITTHIINVGAKHKSLAISFFYHGKRFLKYLFQNKLISKDFSELIPTYKWDTHSKLPSTYNAQEIKCIIEAVDRSNSAGKRNYAILLLLSVLGLRASDVAQLKFSNINWDNNTLKIIQFKTSKELELPLLPEIGNAIIDYLKYGRAKSDDQHIFLQAISPFFPVNSSVITQLVKKYFKASGVDISNKHHGSHALRHSLATNLLNENIKMPVISEIMGHTNSQSTMRYLRVDLKSLKRCSLEVTPVSEKFYKQKGGYFYES